MGQHQAASFEGLNQSVVSLAKNCFIWGHEHSAILRVEDSWSQWCLHCDKELMSFLLLFLCNSNISNNNISSCCHLFSYLPNQIKSEMWFFLFLFLFLVLRWRVMYSLKFERRCLMREHTSIFPCSNTLSRIKNGVPVLF